MAENEAQQEVIGQIKSIEDLETPEDYFNFTIEKVSQSLKGLAGETDWFGGQESGKPIVEEEIKQVKRNLQELFDIYRYGGELGGHRFLPHELPAHGIRHVLLQTAFKADLATAVALMDEPDRPFYGEEDFSPDRHFAYADWKMEVYTSLLHEIGYLPTETFGASGEGEPLKRAYIDIHEERGADLAKDIGRSWGLDEQGVNLEQLSANIRATKMKDQRPLHFDQLGELSWEQVTHVADLASYTLAPNYVPDGIADLWWEWKGFVFDEQGNPVNLAQKKYATDSLATYVSSRFLNPGKKGSYGWGKGPADLIEVLFQQDRHRFSEWKKMYDRNLGEGGREECLAGIVKASKRSDSLQLEGSINPHRLAETAQRYLSEADFLRICVAPFETMLSQQLRGGSIFERLPTRYLRDIFLAVKDEKQQEFLAELIQGVIEESAQEHSQQIQIKLSPLAWQFAAGEDAEPSFTASFFVDAFSKAKENFLTLGKAGKRTKSDIQLAITLRREDGKGKNLQVVGELAGQEVAEFDIAGDERTKQWHQEDTIAIVREIRSRAPQATVAVNLGQLAADETSDIAFTEWQETSRQVKLDSLLYPVSLIGNQAFLEAVLETEQTVIMLPVSQALLLGYTPEQIANFIKDFPDKSRLRLVGGNTMLDSLSMQLFRLVDAGLPQELLPELGVKPAE